MYTLPRIRIFRNIKIILEVSCVRESPMKKSTIDMTVLKMRMFHVKQYDVNGMIRIGETQTISCNYPPSQL